MINLSIFLRAFGIVTCTALNVSQVASGSYVAAFFTGGTLSAFWWLNTKTAVSATGRMAHFMYALGAACGTVTGMAIGRFLNGN
jgi:hypothetical protein